MFSRCWADIALALPMAICLAATAMGRELPHPIDEPGADPGVTFDPCGRMTQREVLDAQRDHPLTMGGVPVQLAAISRLYPSTLDSGFLPILDGHGRPRCLVDAAMSVDGVHAWHQKFWLTHATDGKLYLMPVNHFQ